MIQQAGGGAKNAASTTQDGNGNTAVTKQYTNARGAGSNPVTFDMPSFTFTNSGGVPYTVGAALETISKPGTFNSTIVQNGGSNTADVNQGSQLSAATGTDYSYVSQQGTGALVDVSQQGSSNNWSSVNQSDPSISHTFSDVTQQGFAGNNISFLNQTSPLYATINQNAFGGDNASYVSQSGGVIKVTQTAIGGVNNSGILQTDGSGTTTVTQTIAAPGSSNSNNSTIWQSGVSRGVSVTQDVILGGTNTSDITQTGGGYTVNQSAIGGTNVSDITSNGGTSDIKQTASRGFTNKSTVIQSGDNSATVTQSQSIAHSGGNNTSTIDQTLTGGSTPNQATVIQVASYGQNSSNITQTGYGNTAYVHQH